MNDAIPEMLPQDVWIALQSDADSYLVDVRTREEWTFVGVPDLDAVGKAPMFVEWASLPGMAPNPNFVTDVLAQLQGKPDPKAIYFLCRSGVRSLHAARAVSAGFAAQGKTVACVNITGGFEGDLNPDGHRGEINGWKVGGVAWRQS